MNDLQKLTAAAALAAEIHRGQCRDEGSPYIEHPLRVASIAANEAGLDDVDLIVTAYLHDVVEDAEDPETARQRIRSLFGERVLAMVETLTKSPDKSIPKADRDHAYHERLLAAPREVQALKICDRLDNTRYLMQSPNSKKRSTYLEETLEKYLPLAEQAGVLVAELKAATDQVRELLGEG